MQYLPQGFSVCEIGNQTFVGDGFNSVKEYYESLGAVKYTALDVNERKDAIICDLNYPFGEEDITLIEDFNLVTNNGTSEHLFNQGQVFKNIHRLCQQEGLMLHILPCCPWLNHGFYNYNPIFFRDLARVNNYEILFYWLANRWSDKLCLEEQDYDELFKEKNPTVLIQNIAALYNEAEVHKDIFNVVCFKKKNAATFKIAMQGKYLKDVEGNISSQ